MILAASDLRVRVPRSKRRSAAQQSADEGKILVPEWCG